MRFNPGPIVRSGIILLSFLMTACCGHGQSVSSGLQPLQGKWEYTHLFGIKSTFLVSGDKVFKVEDGVIGSEGMQLIVDPKSTPHQLELIIPVHDKGEAAEHILGIYEVQGDTLRIGLPPDDRAPGPRPSSFTNENTWVLFRVR